MGAPRYNDRFLDALMDSHRVYVEAQLWYNDALVGPLNVVSGSVSADRNSSIRRTANLTIDPSALTDPILAPRLNPYGSIVKLWRGIRYADNTVKSEQIFTGRIDSLDRSLDGVALQCSDLAATVLDYRFPAPYEVEGGANVNAAAMDLIANAWLSAGGPVILEDTPTNVTTPNGLKFEQERGDALDYLVKLAGNEWFADSLGRFHLRKLPAVISATTKPVWIVDGGDSGVLITTTIGTNRQNVANWIVVDSEPVGGTEPAHGEWLDENTSSATWYQGPYGVVTAFFSGQRLDPDYPNSTAGAEALAATLGANSIAKVDQVSVTCIPNPRLNVGDVVRVFSSRLKLDKMYFVQSLEMPLDPDSAMSMTLYQTLTPAAATSEHGRVIFEPSPLQIPEGCTWQPRL